MTALKRCKQCKIEKPVSEFYRNPPHARGYRTRCKECYRPDSRIAAMTPEQVERKRARGRARAKTRVVTREQILRWNWHITQEQHDAILAAQGGVCAICKSPDPGKKGTWHIDHDHSCCERGNGSCGKCIRGLLCARCNPMLGMARDDAQVLLAAVEYLTQNNTLLQGIGAVV